MKNTVLASAAAAAIIWAAPSHAAECMSGLNKAMKSFRAQQPKNWLAPAKYRSDIRALAKAARILERRGMQNACAEVAVSIKAILREDRPASSANKPGVSQPKSVKTEVESQGAEETRQRKRALRSAKPVAKLTQGVTIEEIIGSQVRNVNDEYLGQIEDVVATGGTIQYLVVSYGGFLGMGEERVAVPWARLKVTETVDKDGDRRPHLCT